MADTVTEGIKDNREKIAVAMNMFQSIGIKVKEEKHTKLLEILFSLVKDTNDLWAFVTIKQTFDHMSKTFNDFSDRTNIKFVDCISRAAGISELGKNCVYIESPTMLEKAGLEIMNIFHEVGNDVRKVVIIDSLSALRIYNDPKIVREFISLLLNRTRSRDVLVLSVLIEEEVDPNELMQLIQLNDKIIIDRESFIA